MRQIPFDTLFTFLDWKKRGGEAVTAFNLSTMLNSLRNIHSGSDIDKEKLKADLLELDSKSCKHQFQQKVIKCILCPRNKSATINCKAAKAKEREKAQSAKNENKKVVVREEGSSLQMEISSSEDGEDGKELSSPSKVDYKSDADGGKTQGVKNGINDLGTAEEDKEAAQDDTDTDPEKGKVAAQDDTDPEIGNTKKTLMQRGNYGKELVNFDKIVKALQATQDRIDTIKIAHELYNSKLCRVWRSTYLERTCPKFTGQNERPQQTTEYTKNLETILHSY